MKRFTTAVIAGMMIAGFTAGARAEDVSRTFVAIEIDSDYQSFEAFNIGGYNFIKLRDIAYAMSGTGKQFDVQWNESVRSIEIVSGKPYTPVGDELTDSYYYYHYRCDTTAVPTSAQMYLDGEPFSLQAYNIDGYNYFKLRDIGALLDFSIEWSEDRTIYIDTPYGYVSESTENTYSFRRNVDLYNTGLHRASNRAEVSPLQQFPYMDEGLAYACKDGEKLFISTPSTDLTVIMPYPILGDVIADEDGNFYVVTGRINEDDDYDTDTVFITKYTPKGKLVKTVGFAGVSKMGEDGNTQIPFDAGNCRCAIHDNILMVNYARLMYNGHQSNNVIGVYTDTMKPITFDDPWDIPYTSHSFNQDVIWSRFTKGFVYADHGDAYDRGFIVTNRTTELNLFRFFLQSNADYNMFIVNATFAQLGGLAETSEGMVLAGASAKSISKNAAKESQNLFIQIFDPTAKEVSSKMFVGGRKRSGAMSFNIYDDDDSPLTPVTDYGVIWLTDYTDKDVISPTVTTADDKIILMWAEYVDYHYDSFYMVLDADGTVITPPVSLGGAALNSYEKPVVHNGKIYWACVDNRVLRVLSADIY